MSDQLTGEIETILYTADSGFTVLRLGLKKRGLGLAETACVVGVFPALKPGESLDLTGTWTTHPKFGLQFKAETCRVLQPTTVEGLIAYLGSGMVKHIGLDTATKIVGKFGLHTLDILDNQIDQIVKVKGIAAKRAKMIALPQ